MSKKSIVEELHKPARKNFKRRNVKQKGINDTWQIDLVEMIPFAKFNKGYKYLLTVIDIFSKFAYAEPVKSKTGIDVMNAMNKIFQKSKHTPQNIHSDQGKEFFNINFKSLMKSHEINHYHTYTKLKASICERFNRTLKNNMWKQFSLQGNYNWLSILNDLMHKYNHTKHRTIKMKPSEVTKKNEKHLLAGVYNKPKLKLKAKFKVNDFVRISKSKGIFQKGYEPNWSTEIFKISKVNATNPVTYSLIDYRNQPIMGGFYELELQNTKHADSYLVEKIIQQKGNRVFVKWLGFDNTHNSWINKKDILK